MMRTEGSVSLWLGWAESLENLERYVEESYPENTTIPISTFAGDIGVIYYDEDYREFVRVENDTSELSELLRGFSYDNTIIPRFIALRGNRLPANTNAAVLLYNYEYRGDSTKIVRPQVRLKYQGSVKYSR